MAGEIKFKLVSAPFQADTAVGGLIDERQIWANGGEGYEYAEVDLGAESPRITGFTSGTRYSAMLRTGTARSFRLKPDRIGLSITSKRWAEPATHDIYKLWQTGKPIAFTPWWDQYTLFCATFGQVDIDAGIVEIGDNDAAYLTPRLATGGDYPTSRYDKNDVGWLRQLASGEKAKLVPGMIGNAIILEAARTNLAVKTPVWTDAGDNFTQTADDGNVASLQSWFLYGPAGGPDGSTSPLTGLTPASEHVISVWIKGTGEFSIGVVGHGSTEYTLDPDKWIRAFHKFTPDNPGEDAFVGGDVGGANPCMGTFSCLQVELGDTPTSYMDPDITPPTTPDSLKINSALGRSAEMTIVVWLRRDVPPSGNFKYLMSANDTADYHILIGTSNAISFNLINSIGVTAGLGAPTGAWEQIVVTRRLKSDGSVEAVCYHNGAELATASVAAASVDAQTISTFPNGMYIGSDLGLTSPNNYGLDMPLDRFRVDGRAWTLQDVEDDYELLRRDGIRAFLAHTAGRYFRFTNVPGGFYANVNPDALAGAIQLEQVGVNPAGVAI